METIVVKSPGRINLIGEHTDYNNGFVLPAAINKAVYVAVTKRDDRQVRVVSSFFDQELSMDLDGLVVSEFKWANYIFGVAHQLMISKYPIGGFELLLDGDVPIGAGMSSSAAVECATIFALNELFELGISRIEMAKLTQLAEHSFAGVRCGIMDMYASLFGKKEHVLQLDCKTLECKYVPFSFEGYSILMMDTQIKHSLASSEYNLRREQCEAGVLLIQQKYPDITSLRDVTLDMINEMLVNDEIIYKRCKYVVEENNRVLHGCDFLKQNNISAFGKLMYETHKGLSEMYEVSCVEMDFLVEQAFKNKQVIGSRMMGGGFGGCTINIIETNAIEGFIADTTKAYMLKFNSTPSPIVVDIEEGTKVVDRNRV